jgi:ubiquinone/menaquinone biosynthesis C-methylase UbiE
VHVHYRYVLEKCQSLVPHKKGRILDYGCGTGDIVEEGRKLQLDIFGVEEFYGGSHKREVVKGKGLLGDAIIELDDGNIPFPDNYFDLVVSNQVFEHVQDLDHVLKEISRVLTSHGRLLCLFPSKGVIREGHCGVPCAHWFPKDSCYRYYWLLLFRTIGFGYHTGAEASIREWSKHFYELLNTYTYYRSKRELTNIFLKYFDSLRHIEDDYISYRLEDIHLRGLSLLVGKKPINYFSRLFCRKMGGLVLIAENS